MCSPLSLAPPPVPLSESPVRMGDGVPDGGGAERGAAGGSSENAVAAGRLSAVVLVVLDLMLPILTPGLYRRCGGG